MASGELAAGARVEKDGKSWRLGGAQDVAWIVQGTTVTRAISSAIPPVFEAYATFDEPEREDADEHNRAVLELLSAQSAALPWWLGYLDTGADDIVFPGAPMVTLYAGWCYVLVEAGPEQAAGWRGNDSWRGALPNLLFLPTAPGCCRRCGTTTGGASEGLSSSSSRSGPTPPCRRGRSSWAKTRPRRVTSPSNAKAASHVMG